METTTGCAPGKLFKSFREAAAEPASTTELPWEPTARFAALSKQHGLRAPRGAKTAEHLEALRKSDPLIRIEAWHDWGTLRARALASRAAKVHQQALITRALRAHDLVSSIEAARASATAARAARSTTAGIKAVKKL